MGTLEQLRANLNSDEVLNMSGKDYELLLLDIIREAQERLDEFNDDQDFSKYFI